MKAIKFLLASTMVVAALPSFAGVVPLTLNFEDAPVNPVEVLNRYTGVTFSTNVWIAQSRAVGGTYGNFVGPGGETANKGAITMTLDPNVALPAPDVFIITVANGFDGSFSMIFGGDNAGASISAYDKAGNHLAQFDTSGSSKPLCSGFVCDWTTLTMNLGDTDVYSIHVSGIDGKQWFDEITFGNLLQPGVGTDVPEPGGVALSLAALGALAWTRKRAKR